jgi:microcystin-dependent protein
MAEETTYNLAGHRVSVTFRGLLHFPHSIDPTLAKQLVFDGQGTQTALTLGGYNRGAEISGDFLTTGNTTISGSTTIGGDITFPDGSYINDVQVLSSGSSVSMYSLNTLETGRLRVREMGSNDYEMIFGNPTASPTPNIFTFRVKNDASKNLYIKNRYADPDIQSPLWINWATGEVNIKNLRVNKIVTTPDPGTSYPPNRPTDPKRNEVAIGSIMMFPSLTVPQGWIECNGQKLSKTTYPELWDIIGYSYGGNPVIDVDIFQAPDLRGLFVRGLDQKRSDEAQGAYDAARKDPTAGRAIGNVQDDTFKSHTHGIGTTSKTATVTVNSYGSGQGNDSLGGSVAVHNKADFVGNAVASTSSSVDSDSTGNLETRPKNIALIYCIKW